MIRYPNTPSNGLIFSHFVQLGLRGIEHWDKTVGPYLKDISQKRVLDLGCGFGSNFVLFLKKKGYNPKELIHLDANPDVFLREKSSRGYMLWQDVIEELFYDWSNDTKIVANAESIPLEDRCIDIVHQDMLYEDNPEIDIDKVYGEIKRILKKGGLYITGDSFTRHIGDKQCVGYDGYFERLNLDFPPRPVYRKIKE